MLLLWWEVILWYFRQVYQSFTVEMEESVFPISIALGTSWSGAHKLIPLDFYSTCFLFHSISKIYFGIHWSILIPISSISFLMLIWFNYVISSSPNCYFYPNSWTTYMFFSILNLWKVCIINSIVIGSFWTRWKCTLSSAYFLIYIDHFLVIQREKDILYSGK